MSQIYWSTSQSSDELHERRAKNNVKFVFGIMLCQQKKLWSRSLRKAVC